MDVLHQPDRMTQWVREMREGGRTIGLVPTMGYLHDGHLSLIQQAQQLSSKVVVSIFINPTQFGPGEDLAVYPRDEARDKALCAREGVAAVFLPQVESMYATDHSVRLEEGSLSRTLCAATRPGHFSGVLTIVLKLFNIVQPDVAVFGEKDAQQLALIRRMVRDLNVPVRIVGAGIVREGDGVAMSSRNAYLSVEERRVASRLFQSLQKAAELHAKGVADRGPLLEAVMAILKAPSGGVSVDVDYVEIVDEMTLQPVSVISAPARVTMAIYVGKTRLIDNLLLA